MKKNLPIALSFLICGAAVVLAQAETKNVQPAWSTTPAYRTLLQKIEPLIKEQKFQAALTLASEEAPRITDPLDQARIMTKITQLEIDRQALLREEDLASKERLAETEKKLAELKESGSALRSRWEAEKGGIGKLREFKEAIEAKRTELQQAERDSDWEKAARI